MKLETGIFISEKAKEKVEHLLTEEGRGEQHFLRVSVVSGSVRSVSL